MRTLLVLLRCIVGMLQSALILGGCAGLMLGSGSLFSASAQAFLLLCLAQVAILVVFGMTQHADPPTHNTKETH